MHYSPRGGVRLYSCRPDHLYTRLIYNGPSCAVRLYMTLHVLLDVWTLLDQNLLTPHYEDKDLFTNYPFTAAGTHWKSKPPQRQAYERYSIPTGSFYRGHRDGNNLKGGVLCKIRFFATFPPLGRYRRSKTAVNYQRCNNADGLVLKIATYTCSVCKTRLTLLTLAYNTTIVI